MFIDKDSLRTSEPSFNPSSTQFRLGPKLELPLAISEQP
jgi:hypothetical protein